MSSDFYLLLERLTLTTILLNLHLLSARSFAFIYVRVEFLSFDV